MKVLFVCEGFDSQSIRAQPWKHVFEIATRMQNQGDEVCVLTNEDYSHPKEETVKDLQVKRIKKRFLFDNDELRLALKGDFDIINWNASGALSALNFMRITDRADINGNLVWTLHSGVIEFSDIMNLKITDFFPLAGFWNNILYSVKPSVVAKKAISLTNLKIITLSKRLRNYLVNSGIEEERTRVIYSGVDVGEFLSETLSEKERIKKELCVNPEDLVLLYYGPLSPFRGVDELTKSISTVSSEFSSAKFVFLGRTSKNDMLNNRLKRRIIAHKEAILVEGTQSRASIPRFLGISNVVVLPFRFWPYVECPLTVLEAMAAGKPVVCTRMGAIHEIVQDGLTGLLVRPKRAEISSAIIRLLRNEKFASNLAQNARKYVERFHSWDYITEQTREAFRHWLS